MKLFLGHRKNQILDWIGTFLVLFILFSIMSCENSDEISNTSYLTDSEINDFLKKEYFEISLVDQHITDFKFKLLDGSEDSILKNRGKVILLNFWAIWCHPCKIEMPDIEELKSMMKNEDFRVLTVNYGDSPQKVRNYFDKNSYTFDVILDYDKKFSEIMRITGLPTTVIIDKNGKIRGKIMGPKAWKSHEMVQMFKSLSQ